ncbi:hypothetical protein ACFX2G_035990 [Malus domestica]
MNKDLDSRWEPESESESDFCSDLPHFSVPRGFRFWGFAVAGGEDESQHLAWHAVASWTWDAQDETCGICRMAFDGCCPDCKLPGDDCPLTKRQSEEAAGNLFDRMTPLFHNMVDFEKLDSMKLIALAQRLNASHIKVLQSQNDVVNKDKEFSCRCKALIGLMQMQGFGCRCRAFD